MTTWLIITIILLSVGVVLLALALLFFVRKSVYIPDKDKEFIEFTIDMYLQYAEELEINSPKQHKIIVKQLERIKTKYFKTDEKD